MDLIKNKESLKEDITSLFSLAWPNIVTSVIESMIYLSSTFWVSHLGDEYLSAAALGNMLCNASGLSIGIGLSTALDTLCTQAYGGKKYKLVGLHFQRAIVILTLACIPILTLWFFTENLLLFFRVDKEIARLSQIWVYWIMPGLWPVLIFEAFRKFLVAQKIVLPQSISTLIITPLHIFNSWFLVHPLNFGFTGAALATSVSNWIWLLLTLFLYLLYLKFKKHKVFVFMEEKAFLQHEDTSTDSSVEEIEDPLDTWPVPSLAIFRGWVDFLVLAIPASASLFLEWGSWEVNALIVAQLNSTSELAAHSVAANTVGLWYCPAIGMAVATSTLVGNSLGANEPKRANSIAILSITFTGIYAFFNGMFAVFYRWSWGRLWSDDPEVESYVAQVMFVLWAYTFFDVVKCIGMSVLRSCGKPLITVYVNFFSCILIGYPVSYFFAFPYGLRLPGVWMGMTTAWLVAGTVYTVINLRMDWQKEAAEAAQRNEAGELSAQDPQINSDKNSVKLMDVYESDESGST